jgi:hypothetical protein
MGNARGPSDKALVSFNAGELSPLLDSRSDLEKAASGCRVLENMIVETYGSVRRRPGTKFVAAVRTGPPPDEPEEPDPETPPVPTNLIQGEIIAVAVQSDGKVLIGSASSGSAPVLNRDGVALAHFVYRLDTTKTIDTGFTCTYAHQVGWLFVQPSGKIIVITNESGLTGAQSVVRLNTDGSVDGTFTADTDARDIVAAAMLSDGRLLLSNLGGISMSVPGDYGGQVTLYTVNGAVDGGFGVTDPIIGSISASGLYGAWAWSGSTPEALSRVSAAGAIVTTYGSGLGNPLVRAGALHSDGRFFIVTDFETGVPAVSQFLSFAADGTQNTFPTIVDPDLGDLAQTANIIALNGSYYFLGMGPYATLRKITFAGSLVDTGPIVFDSQIRAIAVNTDGSMWLVGDFTTFNGAACSSIVKLNSNGYLVV